MYETYFGLHARPFPSMPATETYFPATLIEQARATFSRVVERAEGAGVVFGPAGTGKSLLCQLVADQFRHEFSVVMLSNAHLCSRRALLQNILFELKLPYRGLEEGELRLSLIDYLEPSDRCPQGMLLIIDEAHTMPMRLLEEVRMITNLVRAGQPRVRLILAGTAELEERLASPRLESFQQRIAGRVYLGPLNQLETEQYVRHQLTKAGGQADTIFRQEAYRSIFLATDGVPRLISQVCDHALILACAGGTRPISSHGVEEAWSDLQRLPAPPRPAPTNRNGEVNSIVEFSVLADDFPMEDDAVVRTMAIDGAADFTDDAARVDGPIDRNGPIDRDCQIDEDCQIDREDNERITEPAEPAAPEIPAVIDPFGGSFADEEVVLDEFADWRLLPTIAARGNDRPVVESSTDDEEPIAAALEPNEIDSEEIEPICEELEASVRELRGAAAEATRGAVRVATPVTADLLAIWSQPVFAGVCGQGGQDCWTA